MKGARAGGSRRPFYVVLGIVGVIGAIAIYAVMAQTKKAAGPITIDPRAAVGVKAEGHVMGNPSAPVEIVEFGDFECPGCGQFATVTEPDVRDRLVKTGQARFRFYPFQVTTGHVNTIAAALAAECADDQGKFWEMHDKLFAGQFDWNSQATTDPTSIFTKYVGELGLDKAAFDACYEGRKHVSRIAANAEAAVANKVQSTPTVIVGNKMLTGIPSYDAIKAAVDSARASAPTTAPVDTTKR